MKKAIKSELGPSRAGLSFLSLVLLLLAGKVAAGDRLRGSSDSLRTGPSSLDDVGEHRRVSASEFEAFLRGGKMDINCATREDLRELPGIGPSLADRIVQDRAANGPYVCLSELIRVRGVGRSLLQRIQNLGFVVVDATNRPGCRPRLNSWKPDLSPFQ